MKKQLAIKIMKRLGKFQQNNIFLKVIINKHVIKARLMRDNTIGEVSIAREGGKIDCNNTTSLFFDNLTQSIKYLKASNLL